MVGDISFDGCVRKYVEDGYYNYNETMVKVAEIIRQADIAAGNLESPFVNETMLNGKISGVERMRIYSDVHSASALQ